MTPSGKKLAVFFHIRLSGNGIEFDHASSIFQELSSAVTQSGLEAAADEYTIGSSGGESNYIAVCSMASSKAIVVENPLDSVAELPTVKMAHDWGKANDGYVIYFHGKGSLHHGGTKETWARWRRCMSNVVIWNWKTCVKDLDQGFDCSGAHWLHPSVYPVIGNVPYFGGNFWVATSTHLRRLPEVNIRADRYEAEVFIGKTKHRIKARDHAPHWPMSNC